MRHDLIERLWREDNEFAIDLQKPLPHFFERGHTGLRSAHVYIGSESSALQRAVRYLHDGLVHLRMQRALRIGIQAPLVHVSNNSDDLRIRSFVRIIWIG